MLDYVTHKVNGEWEYKMFSFVFNGDDAYIISEYDIGERFARYCKSTFPSSETQPSS